MTRRARTWWKRLTVAGGIVLVAIGALVLVGQHWIGPLLVASAIEDALAERWQGTVEVTGVEINLGRPSVIERVVLRGPAGQDWLRVGPTRLHLRDWPGTHPVLEEVHVDWVRIGGRFEPDRFELPLRPAARDEPSRAGEYVDLRRVQVDRIELSTRIGDDHKLAPPPARFVLRRKADRYAFRLVRTGAGGDGHVLADGWLDEEGGQLHLDVRHEVAGPEWSLAYAAALSRPAPAVASGRLSADVIVRMDWAAPADARAQGTVELTSGRVQRASRLIAQQLDVSAELRGRTVQVWQVRGRTPSGRIEGSGRLELPIDGMLTYRGRLSASEIPLPALAEAAAPGSRPALTAGRADLEVDFQGTSTRELAVRGELTATARNAAARVRGLTGRSRFDVRLTGDLADPLRSQLAGEVEIHRLDVEGHQGQLAYIPTALLQLEGRQITLEQTPARALEGDWMLAGRLTLGDDEPLTWRAEAATRSPVALERLAEMLAIGRHLPWGEGSADVTITGRGWAAAEVRGELSAEARLALRPRAVARSRVRLEADVEDWTRPDRLRVNGTVDILEASLADDTGQLAGVTGRVRLRGRQAHLQRLEGTSRLGPFQIEARAAISPTWDVSYGGSLTAGRLDLQPLADLFPQLSWLTGGSGSGELAFERSPGEAHQFQTALRFDAGLSLGPFRGAGGELSASAELSPGRHGPRRVSVTLANGRIELARGLSFDGIEASGQWRAGQLEIEAATARGPLGRIQGRLRARRDAGQLAYTGRAEVDELDLDELTRRLWGLTVLRRSTLTAHVDFQGAGLERLAIDASGQAAADTALAGDPNGNPLASTGGVDAQLRLTDLHSRRPLTMDGQAVLSDWSVSAGRRKVLDQVQLAVGFDGKVATLRRFSAATGGGTLSATGRASLAGQADYELDLKADGVDATPLLEAFGRPVPLLRRSSIDLTVHAEDAVNGALALRGRGKADAALAQGTIRSAGGEYRFDLAVRGLGPEPAPLGLHGAVDLQEWTLGGAKGRLAHSAGGSVRLFGRSADIIDVRAQGAGGTGRAWARIDLQDDPNARLVYLGSVTLKRLHLHELMRAVGRDARNTRGRLDVAYSFRGEGTELTGLRGRGAAFFADNRPAQVNALRAVLAFLQVVPGTATRFDARGRFDHVGPEVTIRRGQLAMPELAVVVQPGGTVDLQTSKVDVYILAALLEDLDELVEGIPIAGLATAITSRTNRLRVVGRYNDISSIEVRKATLRDVAQGTVQFFREAVRGGGNLAEDLGTTVQEITPWAR